ncbi:dienelactone hydrolase family protein [Micromonospora inyonensis]|uniref:Dienelactone hydrolase n=1 Tax=Micromonospora inyonensis TaxID=47866 RepID=A0A1C6SEF1_9ACTN|nr:dienelactone hydrolase family protein [Micromonospora inyonensis]SCL27763.1 Dienelactone hydrolase [Micromonospora inyonensis]
MRHILLFHSVYGLRPAVLAAADRLRAAGHRVVTPDLYEVPAVDTIEEGFALFGRIGTGTVLARARAAVADLPPDTVLAGLSMGAGVAGALLADRPASAGLLLLHGTGGSPEVVRAGLPVQLHIADPDAYDPPAEVDAWRRAMATAGAEVEVHRYPGTDHFFTDPDVPGYAPADADRLWDRVHAFLG